MGSPLTCDPVAAVSRRLRPLGGQVVAEAGDVLEDDDRPAVADAPQLEVEGGRRALLDGPGSRPRRSRVAGTPLVPLLDGVELHVEAGRQLAHHAAPGHGHHPGLEDHGTSSRGRPKPMMSKMTMGWL